MQVYLLLILGLVARVAAECPNGCSAHGKCGDFDSCECYRNWMSSDCSERICQFGYAHVDTPKGDLDASGDALALPAVTVVNTNDVYPYGTTEKYPNMVDSAGAVIQNTGHEYMECSNKGICDREAGQCQCFDGYEGSACQRASCPVSSDGVCSGHGTCRSIEDLATSDNNNHYMLWDSEHTLGCECDSGYQGADCSARQCKYGFDPLFYDDEANVRFSNFTFAIVANYEDGTTPIIPTVKGSFTLKFFDAHGEDWESDEIDVDTLEASTTPCDIISNTLEDIPNDVIPDGSVLCHYDTGYLVDDTTTDKQAADIFPNKALVSTNLYRAKVFVKFTLAFPGNPGYLKQPEINIWNDGARPSLYTDTDTNTLKTWVYPNGFQGEDVDLVPDLCQGVKVKLTTATVNSLVINVLDFESASMANLFKTCVGHSDYASKLTVNADQYQWDFGTVQNPHLIKLVDTTASPSSMLCNKYGNRLTREWQLKVGETKDTGIDGRLGLNWCIDNKPAGFYVVTIYDVKVSDTDGDWVVYNRAVQDYAATTYFNVFTTTGTMQVVSSYVNVVTSTEPDGDAAIKLESDTYFSNTVYTNLDATEDVNLDNYDMSCESATGTNLDGSLASPGFTSSYNSENQLECIKKEDYVIILNVKTVGSNKDGNGIINSVVNNGGTYTVADQSSNPKYINIYKVKSIGFVHNTATTNSDANLLTTDDATQVKRNQIVLDMSMNVAYRETTAGVLGTTGGSAMAKLYKFTPPTTTIQNTYAAECSTRGVCNREEGLCECFDGHTNDNCDTQSGLASN